MLSKLAKITLLSLCVSTSHAASLSKESQSTAQYAVDTYQNDMVNSLAKLVQHDTRAIEGVLATDNPAHIAFKNELKQQAIALGLDYKDDGYVVIIGLGQSKDRVGVITHGDIQPYNVNKWSKSPLLLDRTTEPGKLIGRGTEDDKGPISTALYAMKAIKDKNITLNKRIELYVYMAEESDWGPLEKYVETHELPEINITIDAEYPVVTAEKGWGLIKIDFPKVNTLKVPPQKTAFISEFSGGAFVSQIPEDATAVIQHVTPTLHKQLQARAKLYKGMQFNFSLAQSQLTIKALGKSAHSSKPQEGVNAITHLAELLNLKETQWANNGPGTLVNFINGNIGIGLEGKKFGTIAYSDDFMGPMTVAATLIKPQQTSLELHINLRRPQGKTKQQLLSEIDRAITIWQQENNVTLHQLDHYIGDPFVQTNAPQVETLLSVFKHYTGIKDAKPIAIGGGTNSRLFPTAVSFGPSMPNAKYTGHSEHEFITLEQFILNLKMYTAAFIELAK